MAYQADLAKYRQAVKDHFDKREELAREDGNRKCWEKASEFLESASSDSGAAYAYRAKDADRSTAAGLYGWIAFDGARLIGKTRIGRVTTEALCMNDPLMTAIREELIEEGALPT
jgi:hypothetical protein